MRHAAILLIRATEGQRLRADAMPDRHRYYIDDILISQSLAQKTRADACPLPQDQDRQLSDHCPVVWSLEPFKSSTHQALPCVATAAAAAAAASASPR